MVVVAFDYKASFIVEIDKGLGILIICLEPRRYRFLGIICSLYDLAAALIAHTLDLCGLKADIE